MSATTATVDQAVTADDDFAEGKKKATVSLQDLWQQAQETAKRLGSMGGSFLAFILRMIRAVANRIAQLCGAEFRMVGETAAAPGIDSEVVKAEFTGEGAVDAAQAMSQVAKLHAENFLAIAPAFDRLKDKDGGEFLKAALAALSARVAEQRQANTQLLSESEPMLEAARETLGVPTYESAYDMLTNHDTPFQGPPVDPDGQFRVVYEKLTRIEDEIKLAQQAIRSYCVAALEIDELRTIAEHFLSQTDMSEIKISIESDIFTRKVDQGGGESIVRGIESRNNFGASSKVVDLSAASLAKSRARELPAEFSPGIPASEKAPRGVSRFAGMNKLRVGDFSGAEDAPVGESETLEVPNA